MSKSTERRAILDGVITGAVAQGLMHHGVQDGMLSGRTIQLEDRPLVHFGSCSYLGLELDQRLKDGACDAIARYGTQFSSSRAYVSAPPYAELEGLFETMFGAPALLAPTTSLAHLSALPILLGDEDVVVFDQQVHSSVQMALNQARQQGTTTEILRHNRLDVLEDRIRALSRTHQRVWYLADGVYSMYGDLAPMAELYALLDRYEQFHVYIDDAHGLSWCGENGRGHVLDGRALHPRMVLATSLAKGFGVGGGVLVFPNAEWKRLVRTCGGPMIFSGPLQPPSLGAALASARIHLSPEITELQGKLRERIQHCNRLLEAHGLPLVSASEGPIRFVGMGLPRVAFAMVKKLMADGFYTNVSMFPAVPMKRAGVRFTLTNHLTLDDITALVTAMARRLPEVLEEQQTSLPQIRRAFELPEPVGEAPAPRVLELTVRAASPLTLEHHTTIGAIEGAEWDGVLGGRGLFDRDALATLERTFTGHQDPANNWRFHYYVVRGAGGRPVLATFFTEALWKDDLLESDAVSRAIEVRRATDPDYLVSRLLGMGSPLTEGDHLYLDRTQDWRAALRLVIGAAREEQERVGASALLLRDLPAADAELGAFLKGEGFVAGTMPDAYVAKLDWPDEETLVAGLSRNARRHHRVSVAPFSETYEVEVVQAGGRVLSAAELAHLHALYLNVKDHNLTLNTHALPASFWSAAAQSPGWELLLLHRRGDEGSSLPAGVMACYAGADQYVPLVAGLDYACVADHGLYRQCLRQALLRAKALGKARVYLGFGAPLEKARFGAEPSTHASYLLASDTFNLEVLEQVRRQTVRR